MPQGAEPPPPGVTPNFEHPTDVLFTINQVTNILCICLITFFVLVRIFIKVKVIKSFLLEDWTCLAAWFVSTLFLICSVLQGHFGGGEHQWEVTKERFTGFGKALYGNTITYGPASYLTKVTLLLIVARVFSPFRKTVIFIYIFIFAMLGYYVPVLAIKIRACTPIAALWNEDLLPEAQCFNERAIFIADTTMSVVTDMAVLIIPIPLVYTLQMSLRKKLRIMAMLGAGGIATGASVVRLVLVVLTVQPTGVGDETVTFTRFNLLAVAELGIGLICACLPALNILFTRYANESLASKRSRTENNPDMMLSNIRRSDKARRAALGLNSHSIYVEVGSDKDALFSKAREQMKDGSGILKVDEVDIERGSQSSYNSAPGSWQTSGHHVEVVGNRSRGDV